MALAPKAVAVTTRVIVPKVTITYGAPAVDADNKPLKAKVKFKGRDVEITDHDHFRLFANRPYEVPLALGDGFLKDRLATRYTPDLHGDTVYLPDGSVRGPVKQTENDDETGL